MAGTTRTLVNETELLDECGFWKQYTGDVRRPAHSFMSRWYWFARAAFHATAILLKGNRLPHSSMPPPARKSCDLLLVYFTHNQHRTFHAWNNSDKAQVQFASCIPGADWHISWLRCASLSLRYLLPTYRLLARRNDSALTIPWLNEFIRYQAGLVLADELYTQVAPLAVGFSNDHSGILRAFIRVARQKGCKLVYTQHASIGNGFPALHFDLSLLDGVQAYLQYRQSGIPTGEVVITGRMRNLAHLDRPEGTRQRPRHVGLATNTVDSLLSWMRLIRAVRAAGYKAIMRCHPAERRILVWKWICRRYDVELDSGTLESFIGRSDVLVSGLSGTILDAAIRGVPSLLWMPRRMVSPRMQDYYGYERFGLCRRIGSLENIPGLLTEMRLDPMQAGAFEAGLWLDSDAEKRKALSLFIEKTKGGPTSPFGAENGYVRICHDGGSFLVSADYADAVNRHAWLSVQDSQRTEVNGQ